MNRVSFGVLIGALLAVTMTVWLHWQKSLWAVAAIAGAVSVCLSIIIGRRAMPRSTLLYAGVTTLVPYVVWSLTFLLFTLLHYGLQDPLKRGPSYIELASGAMVIPFFACFGFLASLGGLAGLAWERVSTGVAKSETPPHSNH